MDGRGQLRDGEEENARKEGLSIMVDNVQRLSKSPKSKVRIKAYRKVRIRAYRNF